ncbi:MAG: Hpt domain-containing protein [Planctomycetes bacterium]|nr:Hpt domain-containing protein [Planctomycetota bacterium]
MSGREARLQALRAAFLVEAAAEARELERLVAAGLPAGDVARRCRKLAHDLRGSGGSYGFPAVSAAAAALDDALARSAVEGGGAGDGLALLAQGLRAAVDAARGPVAP